jgi:hypothetical protein
MKTVILVFLFSGLFGFPALCTAVEPQWPVVSNIQVSQNANTVFITWAASAEEKDMYYMVEKSTDGLHYKTAAIVLLGFEGTAQYSYLFKEKTNTSKATYRIKQVKQDGSFQIVAERTL